MRVIHRFRKSLFLTLRSRYAYASPRSTASVARRIRLPRALRYPFARLRILLLLSREAGALDTLTNWSSSHRMLFDETCGPPRLMDNPGSAVRQRPLHHPRLRGAQDVRAPELPLSIAALFGEDMADARLFFPNFSALRYLKPFRCRAACLQFWHLLCLSSVQPRGAPLPPSAVRTSSPRFCRNSWPAPRRGRHPSNPPRGA